MEKYDFTMQHLYGENHHHITKILSILQASNLEEAFIRKFYASVPMLNLTEEDYKLYANLARNAFNFLNERSSDLSQVRIYQCDFKDIESDHTIIEIVSHEMPFLFDSAICLLNRLNIDLDRVAHPNIFVQRNKDGKLISIDEELSNNGQQELIIQIRTSHSLSEGLIKQIDAELKNILALVEHSVGDWKNYLLKILEAGLWIEKIITLLFLPQLEQSLL